MRIGIFGGTFNPIHNCHLEIAEEIREMMELESIIFIPSSSPPHKDVADMAESSHRLEMTRIAIKYNPHFQVSDIEAIRKGISYSIDTIKELKSIYVKDQLFFIMGIDAFSEISTWKNTDRLLRICNFIIVSRPDYRFIDIPFLKHIDSSIFSLLDSGERDKGEISVAPDYLIYLLRGIECKISSTDIRSRIKRGEEVKNLLPDIVESYIIKNRLYMER
ncbi:MAG: nicotinate-nucleotide adenylyltransferase [Nitrospirota bacterium]